MSARNERNERMSSLVHPVKDMESGVEFLQFELKKHLGLRYYYPSQERPRDTKSLAVHGTCASLSMLLVVLCFALQLGDFNLAFLPLTGNLAQVLWDFWGKLPK